MISRTLSVMLTYQCNAACADCGTFSSPKDRNHVPLSHVKDVLEQAKTLGFVNVVFTGGEATLRWDDLKEALAYSRMLGFPTRLVTNAGWATGRDEAQKRLDELVEAGLDEINFSTGDEHAKFIPISNIAHAVVASLRRSLRTVVMIEVREQAGISKDNIVQLLESEGVASSNLLSFVESPWMPTNGLKTGSHPIGIAANAANLAARKGCDSVLQTYVLQGNGRFASCCGLGMRRVRELQHGWVSKDGKLSDAIQDAEDDLIKQALHIMGPEKLLARAAAHNPNIEWENLYAHRCHACLRIFQDEAVKASLKACIFTMLPDLVFGKFVDEIDIPKAFSMNSPFQTAPATNS